MVFNQNIAIIICIFRLEILNIAMNLNCINLTFTMIILFNFISITAFMKNRNILKRFLGLIFRNTSDLVIGTRGGMQNKNI